jgi:hypothetical protein
MRHLFATLVFVISAVLGPGVALAADTSGSIRGAIADAGGVAVAQASVTLTGAGVRREAASRSDGSFDFDSLLPGVYELSVSKNGYTRATIADVAVVSGQSVSLSVTLAPSSFQSLQVIGNVVARSSAVTFNNSPASVAIINAQTFTDQSQRSISRIFDETPGVLTLRRPDNGGDSATDVLTEPVVRESLAFETLNLIDGHPVTNGLFGTFFTNYLSPQALGSIEIVKGPGALAPTINGAVGGTINYVTKNPTPNLAGGIDVEDSFDGLSTHAGISGTFNKRLGFVVDYSMNGTPGPLRNTQVYMPVNAGWFVNGQAVTATSYTSSVPAGSLSSYLAANSTAVATDVLSSPLFTRSELLKLRYNLSDSTSFTTAFVGAQSYYMQNSNPFNQVTSFAPGAAYGGGLNPGSIPISFPSIPDSVQNLNVPIYEAELRTTLAGGTLLGRYYTGSLRQDIFNNLSNASQYSQNSTIYGTLSLCPVGATFSGGKCLNGTTVVPAVPTTFNGSQATISVSNDEVWQDRKDRIGGGSVEYIHDVGTNTLQFVVDQNAESSSAYLQSGLTFEGLLPSGSTDRTTSYLARAILRPSDQFTAIFSGYYNIYKTNVAPNGVAFMSNTTYHVDPRLGLTYQPNGSMSFRFSAGSSVAPPYLALLSGITVNGNTTAVPAYVAASPQGPYYSLSTPNASVLPETAFGYDLGSDMRYAGDAVFSWDVYRTNVRNEYVQTNQAQGTYNDGLHGTLPLYITEYRNLADSRYEGVELSLRQVPRVGFGYVLQGALSRAYAYNVPASFYASPSGPMTVNLGLIPGLNYSAQSLGTTSGGAVPYSSGYAEMRYSWPRGGLFSLYGTYYGSNNSLNRPAFELYGTSVRLPVANRTSVEFTIDNLTNIYNSPFSDGQGSGISAPAITGQYYLTFGGNFGPRALYVTLHRDI